MTEATITSKGQVTIPKPIRDTLGLRSGDRVDFIPADKGVLLIPAKRELAAMRGMFKGRRAKPASIRDIKAAIGEMGGES